MTPTAIGIPWYDRAAYLELRTLFSDGHKLPLTYDEWLTKAELTRKAFEAKGARVFRVDIHAHDFAEWCRAKALNLDAEGRNAYAAEVAMRMVTGGD